MPGRRPRLAPARRRLTVAVATATVLLALLTAAYAASGRLPLAGQRAAARAVAMQPDGPIVVNGAEGRAILSASGMRPGSSVTGDVTIGNDGDLPGDFALALSGLSDAPVAGMPLSSVLVLQVADVTRPDAPAARYAGPLAALRSVGVGRIAPGERRVFRFTVTFPGGRPPSADNPLQGARTTAVFTWSATGAAVARPRAPRRATASLAARRRQRPARRRVRATLRCSAACRATISGTVRVRGTRRALRTRTVGVRLRRAGSRRVVVRLPRAAVAAGRRASLRLRLRARVGGRTVVARRTVRLVR